MEAGRELDKLIAGKIFNLSIGCDYMRGKMWVVFPNGSMMPPNEMPELPYYSTDLGAAWKVVEHIDLIGWTNSLGKTASDKWCFLKYDEWDNDHRVDHSTIAESAPHAICLAALAAVEAK